jgi:uridine kinase
MTITPFIRRYPLDEPMPDIIRGMASVDLREMLRFRRPKVGNTLFIAVDGRGGSGKSTLAKYLSEKLNAEVVRTDDFASWENPFDWWPLLIEQVFQPIRNGTRTLHYPGASGWDNLRSERVAGQPVTEIMILEGVSSSRKEFRQYISLSIFIDAPKDISLRRGLERDRLKGKRSESELIRLWEGWSSEEDIYLQRDDPKRHADIVIDGTLPFEDQLAFG